MRDSRSRITAHSPSKTGVNALMLRLHPGYSNLTVVTIVSGEPFCNGPQRSLPPSVR
jgi:hypothetical protein